MAKKEPSVNKDANFNETQFNALKLTGAQAKAESDKAMANSNKLEEARKNTRSPKPEPSPKFKLGDTVIYSLSKEDSMDVNGRRAAPISGTREQIPFGKWHPGAVAHQGTQTQPGDCLPAIVVAINNGTFYDLQVFLDGNDTLWVEGSTPTTSPTEGAFSTKK